MPVRVKKLIVNADDFGLTSEVNEGIMQAFKKGILTSASLIATGNGFSEAIRLIQDNPLLDLGVHLTLIEEKSVLSKKEIPTLVDESGNFRKNIYYFIFDYALKRISIKEIEKEFRAQIERILDFGIKITHIDSHQHIHMLPKILKITFQLAEDFGIKHIRFPKEKLYARNLLIIKKSSRLLQQVLLNIFCMYSRKYQSKCTVDNFYGFFDGGHLDKKRFLKFIKKLNNSGITEVMCHPALWLDGKTWSEYSHWKYEWQDELVCLLDEDVLNMIKKERIQLTSFTEI